MSLSDLAALGSFVSGFAVLLSLIYLALQVRQTKRNQQIAIRHSRATRVVDLHLAPRGPRRRGCMAARLGEPAGAHSNRAEPVQQSLSSALLPLRRLVLSTRGGTLERRRLRDRRCWRSALGEKPRLSSRLEPRATQLWRTVPGLHGRSGRRVRRRAPRGPVTGGVDLSLEEWKDAFASEASRTS